MIINMIALIIVTVFGGLVYFGLERKTARGGAAGLHARICDPTSGVYLASARHHTAAPDAACVASALLCMPQALNLNANYAVRALCMLMRSRAAFRAHRACSC